MAQEMIALTMVPIYQTLAVIFEKEILNCIHCLIQNYILFANMGLFMKH